MGRRINNVVVLLWREASFDPDSDNNDASSQPYADLQVSVQSITAIKRSKYDRSYLGRPDPSILNEGEEFSQLEASDSH